MIDTIEVIDTLYRQDYSSVSLRAISHCSYGYRSAIVPKEEVEGWGDDFVLHPIGSGPYVLKEWVKDDHMSFERYENYWGEKPYVKKLTYKFIPDKAVLTLALLSGQVDITSDVLDQDIPKVTADPNVEAVMVGGNNIYAAYMNATKGPIDLR